MSLFDKMPFDKFYKIILFISAIILFFSLFLPYDPAIEKYKVEIIISTLIGLLYGTIAWFLDNKIIVFYEIFHSKPSTKQELAKAEALSQLLLLFIFIFLLWFFWFLF
jgi:hypothetical protein